MGRGASCFCALHDFVTNLAHGLCFGSCFGVLFADNKKFEMC